MPRSRTSAHVSLVPVTGATAHSCAASEDLVVVAGIIVLRRVSGIHQHCRGATSQFEQLIELPDRTRGCAGWFVCELAAAICSVSGLISWILSPTKTRASALISLMAVRTQWGGQLLQVPVEL